MNQYIGRTLKTLTDVVLVSVTSGFCIIGETETTVRTIELARPFGAESPIPIWENDLFVGIDSISAPIPNVYSYGPSGEKLFEVRLTIDDAIRITVSSVAASRDGVFAVSGSAYSKSGDGARFIAFLNRKGQLFRVIRTGTFAALHLCFADNGMLWVAGRVINYPLPEEPSDHDVLRVYNADGTFRASMLPKSSFPASAEFRQSHPARISRLASNGKVVAFLSASARELVLFSSVDGTLNFRRSFPKLGSGESVVTGLAISPDSTIYLSCQVPLGEDRRKVSVAYYRWNVQANQWVQIYSHLLSEAGGYFAILGAGQEGVLTRADLPRFTWLRFSKSE